LLSKIDRLEVLFQLYGKVLAPKAVRDEVQAGSDELALFLTELIDSQKLKVQKVGEHYLQNIPEAMGPGEREAIALALQTNADLIVIDEQVGRTVSRDNGLKTTGTIGVLIEAQTRGLVVSMREELDKLIESGMWISEIFYHRLIQEFGQE
jgi:hypothetical protein